MDLSNNDLRSLTASEHPRRLNLSGNPDLDVASLPVIFDVILGDSGPRLSTIQQLYTDERLQHLVPEILRNQQHRVHWSLKTPTGCVAAVGLDGAGYLAWDVFVFDRRQWMWIARTFEEIWDVHVTPASIWLLAGVGRGDPPSPWMLRFEHTGASLPTHTSAELDGVLEDLQHRGSLGAFRVDSDWMISRDHGEQWAPAAPLPPEFTAWVTTPSPAGTPCPHPTGMEHVP